MTRIGTRSALALLWLAAAAIGCKDGGGLFVRNQPPRVQVSLAPEVPGTLDDLVVTAVPSDVDGDHVTLAYAWYRNGVRLDGQTGPTLPASETTKGDLVRVVVTASDGRLSAEGAVAVTIGDTPPVIAAPALVEVAWGEQASFALTASDPDGEPVGTVALASGPAGLTLAPDGAVAWSAVLPMFDRTLDVRWAAGIPGTGASASGVIRVTDPDREYPLRRSGIEIPTRRSGLEAVDLDGDGTDELLVAGRTGLYALGRAGAGYAQRWMYPFSPGAAESVGAIVAADLDGDTRAEIVFSTGDLLVTLDGVERREVRRLDADGAWSCLDLELVDVDADGATEVVCLGQTSTAYDAVAKVVVLDAATLAVEWATTALGLGGALATGDVDGDGDAEVVTAGGWVFDGTTGENEWAYAPGFGWAVDTGDVDGDGVEEIVGVGPWGPIRGYSATLRSPLWEGATSDVDALLVTDLDADGKAELVLGDGQWGDVTGYAYRAATNDLELRFQLESQGHGTSALAVGDLDGDGALELAWGTGGSTTGEDLMVVAGLAPAAVEWKNVGPSQLDGPFVGARRARLAEGREAILFATAETDSGYAGTRLVALDPATGDLTLSPEVGSNWSGVAVLDAADYDRDGVDEAFLLTSGLYDGYFTVSDVGASTVEWTSASGLGTGRAVAHGDLNGDGDDELVALTTSGYVHVYDPKHQTLVWKSTALGTAGDLAVADLDGDGRLELVVAAGDWIRVYRKASSGPVTYLEHRIVSVMNARDLVVADTDGDGTPEVFALSGDSYAGASLVTRLDADLEPLSTFTTAEPLQSLHLEDLGTGRKNLVGSVGDAWFHAEARAHLVALDPATGAEVWRSPDLWSPVPLNSLSYVGTAAAPVIAFGTTKGMYLTR